MNVDHAIAPRLDEAWRHDAHETGKRHELYPMVSKRGIEGVVEFLASRERFVVDDLGRDTLCLREIKSLGISPIGNDDRDLCRITSVLRRPDERLHVGAAPRNKYAGPLARLRQSASLPRGLTCSSVPLRA